MTSNSNESAVTLQSIHVPWYNTDEWKTVYNQLFKEDATKHDMKKALNTLMVWKLRMPRLYALIEGTLILVKCFVKVDDDFSDDISKQIVAAAVLRFLNVCLCNSKSRHTLFDVAKTKNLPDWIIDIRHNFAHSQTLSSPEMLNRALKYLFNWLKENYWDEQIKTIDDSINVSIIEYEGLLGLYEQVVELSEKDYSATKLRRLLTKYNIRFNKSKYTILQRIALALIEKLNLNTSIVPIVIIKNKNFINDAEIRYDGFIVPKYLFNWNPLIFALIHWRIFYKFLKMLVTLCCKNDNIHLARRSAAWIKSICKVVNEDKSTNILKTNEDKKAFQNFAYWTISNPNLYMKHYIKELLVLGKFSNEFIFYTCEVAEALVPKPNCERPKQIYTVDCLRGILKENLNEQNINGNTSETSGWQIVEDTSIFDGLPLGKQPFY